MKNNDSKFLDDYSRLLNTLPSNLQVIELGKDMHSISPKDSRGSNKIALVALTHGDEVIGLHIFIKLLKQLISTTLILNGELILVIANRNAYLKNQRYIENDLNRSYGTNDNTTLEGKRSQSIRSIISECDYIIDIHQCIEDTLHPFFILPFSKSSYTWVTNTAPNIPVIIRNDVAKATTLSSYGFLMGKKAVTFEVGAYGFDHNQLESGYNTIKSFLQSIWGEERWQDKQAINNPTYEIKYFQPYSKGVVRFSKSFKNFETIEKGKIIAYVDEKPIHAPLAGKILLYPRKWFAKDSLIKADGLFFILQAAQIQNKLEESQ